MGPGFESLCAHHKISLTNAVSLRNFSATRSLVRSVAFLLPHESKNSHTKPCAKCGFFVTTRKQKFPHEALCEVWLFRYHAKAKIPTRSLVRSAVFIYTIGCMCINSCTYSCFLQSHYFKYEDGLYALVPLRISKCNCGSSTLPVSPTVPIFCPTLTLVPRRTIIESKCAYTVIQPPEC